MRLKKILAMLLAGTMVAGMSMSVFAEEGDGTSTDTTQYSAYVPTETYVLNYADGKVEGYEKFDQSRFYYSPYRMDVYVPYSLNWCSASVYNMINTNLIDPNETDPTEPYASIPVYCVDVDATSDMGDAYRRINLEDAEHFDDDTAARIRAIYMNSFPYCTTEAVAEAVGEWIQEKGLSCQLQELNHYEIISATQTVIWAIIHNGYFNAESAYAGYNGYEGYDDVDKEWYETNCIYDLTGYESETASNKNNINIMVDYLLDLAPMAPLAGSQLISESSFTDVDVSGKLEADGTYTYAVDVTIDANVGDDDKLTLSAVIDGLVYDQQLIKNGSNKYEFSFTGLDQDTIIKLAIDGTQTAGDVYLFDAIDAEDDTTDNEESQPMAGYDNSALPVHAEVVLRDRIINFEKTTEIDGTYYPLEGIEFEIYYAGTVDAYTTFVEAFVKNEANAELLKDADEAKKEEFAREAFIDAREAEIENTEEPLEPVYSAVTDATGKASYNVTEDGQDDGVYLIIEKEHPAISKALAPFLIAVPMTTPDGSGLSYTVNLQPKNDVVPGPEVEKNVTEIGTDLDSYGVGKTHTWILRGEVPVDIANGKSYVLTDVMDYRLTYIDDPENATDDVRVALEPVDPKSTSTSVTLEKDVDYTLVINKDAKDTNNKRIDTLQVSLTKAGMTKIAEAVNESEDENGIYTGYEVRVYFSAYIDSDAIMGATIPNDVTLDYKNSVGFEYQDEDDAKVYTCGIEIDKYDAKDESIKLGGAVFKLAKVVEEGTPGATSLVISKDATESVVYEDFYTDESLAEEFKASTVTTIADDPETKEVNEAVPAKLYGLKKGVYYLVEIQAPAGYNLLSYPVPVELTISDENNETEKVVLVQGVANSNQFKLPETGGIGTTIFTISGMMMLAAAVVVLVMKKKKEQD